MPNTAGIDIPRDKSIPILFLRPTWLETPRAFTILEQETVSSNFSWAVIYELDPLLRCGLSKVLSFLIFLSDLIFVPSLVVFTILTLIEKPPLEKVVSSVAAIIGAHVLYCIPKIFLMILANERKVQILDRHSVEFFKQQLLIVPKMDFIIPSLVRDGNGSFRLSTYVVNMDIL
ncbi:hypothetical protein BKA69DRAFT_1125374 [Paraphysoderma sedebokerense]|nr:hypothetical protein BKA69DRAFT_1125374 [Paraphysoderma sedebokerense]